MWREKHKAGLPYAVATASVGVALYLTLILEPFIHPSVFPLFFAAVTVGAWYGGFWPGMVAAALSDISIDFYFIEPAGLSLDFNDFMRLAVFTLVTGLTSSLAARRKRAEEALRQTQQQLEVRVQERTVELSQTNEALRAEILTRERTENSLRESEQKFRSVAENIQEVFWLCDPDIRHIYYISPAYERIWGRTCQSLYDSPQSFLDSVHPEDRERAIDTVRNEMRNGFDLNFRIVRPDGTVRWVRDRAFPIQNESGGVHSVAGIAEDVTEVTQSQELLKRQAEIIDQIHDAVVSTDLDGYVTSWNKGAERIFGYSTAEALNQNISFVYPESEKAFLERAIIEPLKKKHAHEVEVRMRRKSGEEFYAHLALSLLKDNAGSAFGMIGYSMDITARKRAERELQTRIRQQAAVAELGQRALTEPDLSALMDEAVKQTAKVLEVDYAKVLELLPDKNVLLLRAGVGWKEGEVGRRMVSCGVESQAGYTLQSQQPVVVLDLQTEPRFTGPALLTEHGVTSGMSVIIGDRESPFGILGAHTTGRRAFGKDDVHFLQAVANVLAEAIERMRSEKRLRDSEEHFRTSFDYAPIGKALETPDGHLLRVNQALCEIVGYESSELLATTLKALAHPEDRNADAPYRRELLESQVTSYELEKRYTHKDGHLIWTTESVALARGATGEPVHFIIQIQDITQRKRAEDERQQLLAQLAQRVKELTVLHDTARLLEREGMELEAQLQAVVAIFPSGWQFPEITGARILFDGSEYKTGNFEASRWHQREDFTTLEGKPGAVEVVYLEERPKEAEGPFLAEERSLLGSVVEMVKLYLERKEAWLRVAQFTHDLEERNKELLRLQGEIGRVERLAAVGQIAGSIAHDLGTPLNSILGYTQMLVQEARSENAQRRLHIIKTQIERMIEIINQYLARSRSSFQKREIVNANKLIEETLDLLRPMFQRQEVEVATNLSNALPLIRGDAVSLQRVLTNLLDNAMDAMGSGGRIAITTTPAPPSGPTRPGVSIVISDTGPGIPADILPKIFDFFVTTKASGKGTGIGLAVCKEIVKQHEGTIQITSEEGQGTNVMLVFPAGDEDEIVERDEPTRAG